MQNKSCQNERFSCHLFCDCRMPTISITTWRPGVVRDAIAFLCQSRSRLVKAARAQTLVRARAKVLALLFDNARRFELVN